MFVKINGTIEKIDFISVEPVTEEELIAHFNELIQLAYHNPWRGVELARAKSVLNALRLSEKFSLLNQRLIELERYRREYLSNPNNKRQPRNWSEAMARHS